MAIKKLQNDFTTPEQSKRLLELGVPADSVDCVYECDLIGGEKYYSKVIVINDYGTVSKYKEIWESSCINVIPCWSVGRLIEIDMLCDTEIKPTVAGRALAINYADDDFLQWCVSEIKDRIKEGRYDFSKLEE